MSVPHTSIKCLDYDVLTIILEHTHELKDLSLCALSSTCRSLRQLAMPIMYCKLSFNDWRFSRVLPHTLLPHIKIISLVGLFPVNSPRNYAGTGIRREQMSLNDHLLLDALRQFPRLQSVVVMSIHGLPRHIARALLSVSQLQDMQVHQSLCLEPSCDPTRVFRNRVVRSFPHRLVSFSETRDDFSPYPTPSPDLELTSLLFKNTHSTLETIRLTGDVVPERTLLKNDWPRLRELIIRGERPVLRHPRSMTMLSVCSRMPNLRVLKLELAQHAQTKRIPLWPQGWTAGFPWPDLEVLTVTYPDPDDVFFAHLPHTLRQLSLRCYPRHHILERYGQLDPFLTYQKWASPIPTATEMLRILRRSTSSYPNQLTHLDIEFESDGQDSLLVQHIGTSFPALVFLQFHGCSLRQDGREYANIIGAALAPLARLRILRLHLTVTGPELMQQWHEAALEIARSLGASAKFVCFFRRRSYINYWWPFHVLRNRETGAVDVAYDDDIEETDGYSVFDDPGPLLPRGVRPRR